MIVENPTKTEHGFEVTRMSLFNLQVCSRLNAKEIRLAVNHYFQSGTSAGWVLETSGKLAPVKCSENDGNIHYIFTC